MILLAHQSKQPVTCLAQMVGIKPCLLLFDMYELFFEEDRTDENGDPMLGWNHTRSINIDDFLLGKKEKP